MQYIESQPHGPQVLFILPPNQKDWGGGGGGKKKKKRDLGIKKKEINKRG